MTEKYKYVRIQGRNLVVNTLTAKGVYKIHTHFYFRSAGANDGLFNVRLMQGTTTLLEGVTAFNWSRTGEGTAQCDNDLVIKSDGTTTLKAEVRANVMDNCYFRQNKNFSSIIVEYLGSWS